VGFVLKSPITSFPEITPRQMGRPGSLVIILAGEKGEEK
jgi:hypothetical protein